MTSTAGHASRCVRCARFKIECSFERDPPHLSAMNGPPNVYSLASAVFRESERDSYGNHHPTPSVSSYIPPVAGSSRAGSSTVASPETHTASPHTQKPGAYTSEYPVAPLSPPRTADHSDALRSSMELVESQVMSVSRRGNNANAEVRIRASKYRDPPLADISRAAMGSSALIRLGSYGSLRPEKAGKGVDIQN